MMVLRNDEYNPIEHHNTWLDRGDLITLFALVATVVTTALMIHKLSTVSYNSLRNKGDATVSFDETSNADPPDFDRSSTSEEEPIEVTIERPWHTLSYFDKIWCYRKEHPERTKERGMPTEEPVLNIVWEQTPCRPSNMTSTTLQDSSEPQCVGKRELISCIPMTVKKPRQSGRGFVSEPVTLKVHLEPMEAADDKCSDVLGKLRNGNKNTCSNDKKGSLDIRLGKQGDRVDKHEAVDLTVDKTQPPISTLSRCSHINLAAVNETSSSSESSTTNEACWNMNNASSVTKDKSTTIMRSTSSTRAPTAKKNSLAIENRNFTAEPKIASAAKDEPVTKDVGTFSLTSDQELCKPDSN